MRRYIRRGSKGIALVDTSRGRPILRYVFDVSDTGRMGDGLNPNLWQYRDEHRDVVAAALERRFAVSGEHGFEEQLEQIAARLAREYWTDHQYDILHNIDGSFLEGYDAFNVGAAFQNAASVSITYTLLSRCGLEDHFQHEDFLSIFDFNTKSTITTLGMAVSQSSEQVLRQIEITVKRYEREKSAGRSVEHGEQSDLHPGRGLPDSQSGPAGAAGQGLGQVRADAPAVSEGAPASAVGDIGDGRDAVQPPAGDRGHGQQPVRADDAPAGGSGGSDGTAESQRPDDVGGPDEQLQGPSGGSDSLGAGVQLSFLPPVIPSQQQQIAAIQEAESVDAPSAFSVPKEVTQADIDAALQEWNGDIASKRRVQQYMERHAREKGTAAWLKNEYGDNFPAYPVHGTDGGGTDLPWSKVQRHLARLVKEDRFFTEEELDNFADIDTAAVREQLEQAENRPSPFVEQVIADVEQIDTADLPPHDPLAPPYKVGDTVYLDNTAFQIVEISPFDVQLRDPALLYPILRSENKENFERLLHLDKRNSLITDYLPADLSYVNDDIREVLTSHLLTDRDKDYISGWIHSGENNRGIAIRISEALANRNDSVTLETGDTADYFASAAGLEIDIQDKFNTRLSMSWDEAAPVLRVLWLQELDGFTHEPEQAAEPEQIPSAENFRITDDDLGVGGPKVKFRRNIEAITALHEIEFDGRRATPAEQEILSRYVGWGGLPDAFDPGKPAWAKEYKELQVVLSPEEYTLARASSLNAHYTSPTVVKAIYEAVENMGFVSGNILEPSCGVGNFFGLLPESMAASKLYGVELDSVTGRIAQQLYPKADITVQGYENASFPKDFFDLAIGNVPFGQYSVYDPEYSRLNFSIHNYFFAKTLDRVRPGGIVAFVTSRYTLDAKDSTVRRYLAERADLLGAIRLPNNAFKANAGTEVVSDIVFLQKRDRPIVQEPDWVHLGVNEDGFSINSYFVSHPEMILGRQSSQSTQYAGQDFTVEPIEGLLLADQLHDAVKYIRGRYQEAELPDLDMTEPAESVISADPTVKNYSFAVMDGDVYYRENSVMVKPRLTAAAMERVKGMVELRDCTRKLIDLQMDEYIPDSAIREQQAELDRLYNSFSAQYGLINDRANRLAFSKDSSYYLLCSLEVLDEDGRLERKADMFTLYPLYPVLFPDILLGPVSFAAQ